MMGSVRSIDYQRTSRPVAAMVDEYEAGSCEPPHCHERSQLLYACAGVMGVTTAQATYVVPPLRAVWIPAAVEHEVRFRTRVSLRTLYIESSARQDLPNACCIIAVSNLLRELILEAMELPVEYGRKGRDERLMELILDEIVASPAPHLRAPMPVTRSLGQLCRQIIANPAENYRINELAERMGSSRRTFTRKFREETGVSFAAWLQHVRLLEAKSRLAAGQSIAEAAREVGYRSPSAFTAMFHRQFGITPSEYLSEFFGSRVAP